MRHDRQKKRKDRYALIQEEERLKETFKIQVQTTLKTAMPGTPAAFFCDAKRVPPRPCGTGRKQYRWPA